MTHALEGVQFRNIKPELPNWKEDFYEEWQDVPAPGTTPQVFSSGTQFRMKPVIHYVVTGEENTVPEKIVSKADVLPRVDSLLTAGSYATIKLVDNTPDFMRHLFNKYVQFSFVGTGTWRAVSHLNINGMDNRITFRIRPDRYFQVVFSNPLQGAVIDFDDVEKLAEYVNGKIRTGSYDFTVRSIKYGI